MHPSWRDLVIDKLASSAARRRAFLQACGVPGVELALSTAGGATGRRRLPLICADEDWDALGDAVHRLCLIAAQDELTRLLTAVETAIAAWQTRRERTELEAIADVALHSVRRRLDHEAAVIDALLLERWHTLASRLDERPKPPDLARTLDALDPIGAHPADPASARRLDEYLAINETSGDPLPDAIGEQLIAFVRTAEAQDELSTPTLDALRRLARLHRPLRARILALLSQAASPLEPPTFSYPPPPPTSRSDPDASRIRQILADL